MEEEDWKLLYEIINNECTNLKEDGLDFTLECALKTKLGAYIIENDLIKKTITNAKWGL